MTRQGAGPGCQTEAVQGASLVQFGAASDIDNAVVPARRQQYRRAAAEVALSLPERRYDLAALLMARAIELSREGPGPVTKVLGDVARDYGRAIGARAHPSDDSASPSSIELLAELLAKHDDFDGEVLLLTHESRTSWSERTKAM